MTVEFKYDVFISHSTKDKAVVCPLAERLRNDGLKVWFDDWEIKPGDNIPAKIEEGLEHSRALILCMSSNAFDSDWAQLESQTFRFADPLNKQRRLIPLRLDEVPIKGSLAQFRYISWSSVEDEQSYAELTEACKPTPVPTTDSERNILPTLSLFDASPDESASLKQLKACTRFPIAPLPQHRKVRMDELSQCENALRQRRLVWISADWATGVDGFLSVCLDRFRGVAPEPAVFHLRCEDANDIEQFETLFPQQFAMPIQRFCALLSQLETPFLFLDAIPPALAAAGAIDRFRAILAAILDYCPTVRIVITSRPPPQDATISHVHLHALEAPDFRTYLLHHPDATADLREPDVIEKLHERSDGLPAHIDRMLRALKVSSLDVILDAELEGIHPGQVDQENVPKALAQVVDSLTVTTNSHKQRSLRLLKVLSVLPYGEPFEGMRHYLPTEPFFIENAVDLNELGLLEVIPLSMPAPRVVMTSSGGTQHTAPKLLKVPRQVRDYVQSLLNEKERDDFMVAGADQFFGPRWRDSKIRPRVVPVEYRELLDNRPGNEFAIIHYLLQQANVEKDALSARRAANLAVHYCATLRRADRFRDLVIVAGGILQVTDSTQMPDQWAVIASMYGLALRMTGKRDGAVTYLRQALSMPEVKIPDEVKASMLLNIALAEESMRHETEAVQAAEEVKCLCDKHDVKFFQAHCVIEGYQKTREARVQRLKELAQEAQTRGFTTIANNLTLDLARETKRPEEKSRLLSNVLTNSSADLYNRTRAIAEKTNITLESGRDETFTVEDRVALSDAYSYAHSQRFGSLFDSCHDGMWRLLVKTGDMQQLLRLFRHSSFIWRIRGEEAREAEYAKELSSMKPPDESTAPARQFVVEVCYYWKRLKVILSGELLT